VKQDCGEIQTKHFDCGSKIGIAVTRNGERRTVKIPNPFAEEIDAEWRATHG
jgi:hypothetical protein